MGRCIQLAKSGAAQGEYPFGSLVALGETVISEGVNSSIREMDESRHAEIIAIAHARRTLPKKLLRDCTIYSTVEPCAMCSFVIRAAGIRRVVFALHSPVMGGMSRWDILQHQSPSRRLRLLYGPAPEIVTGVCAAEAQNVWSDWRPFISRAITMIGFFVNRKANRDLGRQRLTGYRSRLRALMKGADTSMPSRPSQ
jgi:tRNA(adenine34) deaminase